MSSTTLGSSLINLDKVAEHWGPKARDNVSYMQQALTEKSQKLKLSYDVASRHFIILNSEGFSHDEIQTALLGKIKYYGTLLPYVDTDTAVDTAKKVRFLYITQAQAKEFAEE